MNRNFFVYFLLSLVLTGGLQCPDDDFFKDVPEPANPYDLPPATVPVSSPPRSTSSSDSPGYGSEEDDAVVNERGETAKQRAARWEIARLKEEGEMVTADENWRKQLADRQAALAVKEIEDGRRTALDEALFPYGPNGSPASPRTAVRALIAAQDKGYGRVVIGEALSKLAKQDGGKYLDEEGTFGKFGKSVKAFISKPLGSAPTKPGLEMYEYNAKRSQHNRDNLELSVANERDLAKEKMRGAVGVVKSGSAQTPLFPRPRSARAGK